MAETQFEFQEVGGDEGITGTPLWKQVFIAGKHDEVFEIQPTGFQHSHDCKPLNGSPEKGSVTELSIWLKRQYRVCILFTVPG